MNFEEIRRRNGVGVGAGSLSGSGSGSSFNGIREKYTTPTQGNTNTAGSGVFNTSGGTSKTSSFSSSTSDIISSNFDKMGSSKGIEGYNKYLADFAAAEDDDEEWWETLGRWLGGGIVDTTLPTAGVTQTIQDLRADNSYRLPRDDWREEHKSKFGELYLTSPEAAFSYAEDINKTYNEYKEADDIYHIQKDATSSVGAGIGNTVGAILTAPLAAADFLGDLAYANAGREIAPDGNISPFEYSQAVTSGISTHLNKEGGTLPEDWAIIGGKGWGDVYGLGVSTTQSILSAYTLGSAGTLVSYFGQGAAAGVDDAKARGASDEVAVLYGVTVGTFEAVAEKMGIDNLFKLDSASTLKGVIKNIIKQSGAEGAEEGVTALLTNIADNVWMNAVSPEGKSNFDLMVEELMAQGMSEGDAKNMAWWKSIEGIFYDTLSGSVSGGISGGVHTVNTTVLQNIIDSSNAKEIYGDNAQDLVTEALEIDPENPLALKAQAKLDAGKSITEEQLNKLAKTTKTEEGKKNAEKYAKTEELLESDALEKGLENAGTIAGAAVNGVKNAFDDAASGAEGAVKDAVSGVVNNVSSSVEGMLGLAENTFDEVTKNLWGGISDLWGGLSGIGQNAQRAVENGVNAAKDAVGGAIDGAKDAAGNAVSATVDKVKSAVESELSALGEAGERASEIADVIAKKLRGIDLSEAEQKLFDTSDAAKQAFANLGGEISEGANDAASKVGETVTSIKDKVKDTLDSLGEVRDVPKLTDIITKKLQGIELTDLEQKIFDVSEHGKEALESLKGKVEDAVGGVKSTVEGAIDKATGAKDNSVTENDTETETSTESEISASETTTETESSTESSTETTTETNTTTDTEVTVEQEGVATDTKVESIESITESGVNLKLQNDTIVNSTDVSFKNTDIGLVYQAVTDMTTRVGGFNIDTANTFVKGYTPDLGIPAGEYIHGWSDAYRFGAKGFPASELVTGTFTSRLPAKLRNTAYNFGKAFGNDAIAKSITPSITKPTVSYQTITRRQGSVVLPKGVSIETLTPMQRDSIKGLEVAAQALGKKIHLFESELVNGKRQGANGWYDPETGDIHLDIHAGIDGRGAMLFTGSHELTHDLRVRNPQGFKRYADAVLDSYVKHFGKDGLTIEGLIREKLKHLERNGRLEGKTEEEAYDLAYEEVIADSAESMLTDSKAFEEFSKRIQKEDKSLWNKIKRFFSDLVKRIKAAYEGVDPDSAEGKLLREMGEDAERLQKIWVDALMEAADSDIVSDVSGESDLVQIDADTESVAPLYSERTWTESEYVTERDKTAKNIAKALGVSLQDAYKYIDDINGVARLIADDRVRLDYEPNLDEKATVLKPNSDYKYSVDMSTLCAKRLLFTGTFDAIQRELPNTVFDSEDIVALREMMQKRGYEVACGICYVESTRREIGRITQDFINGYKEAQKTGKPIQRINSEGKAVDLKKTKDQMETTADKSTDKFFAEKGYTPTLADLNTTDIDFVKRDHPLVYEAYLNFMNARGQAKPKLLETRAEYKGEILNHFKAKNAVKARNDAGGLRLQSFSDFEVPHMIDMMQIVMDMSRVGLKSQAYTKVPAFAEVFGDTGVKINLSLIAKGDGLDSKGNLVFDDVEGINHKEAFALRDKYSKNVGTILVGKTDAHIIAAMADPRIDYIIPFHKSSWKESLYDALGLTGYADYTDTQNEKPIDKDRKIKNFDPSEYWDFTKSGDENAQIYLEKCREDGRIPKFPQFQGYPGYWKLLIDFKMYDNDGVGSPQEVVRPIFNTEASERILSEYKGGHKSFPVAKDVVRDFVKEHKNEVKYSDRASQKASYAPTFYSHMGKVIDDVKLEKMGTSSILNHLKNRGVKDEEIKWSGIEAFLEGKKSVTKAELQEFVAGSQIQITEQVSGEGIDLRYDGSKRAYNLYDSKGEVIDTFTYNEFLDGYVADSDEEIYSNPIELREALREIHGVNTAPRWADYKLDGGSNYRELVFQLPNSTYSNRAMRVHWGQDAEGVLAHARIQDMTTSDGKKMLFIEEIQSDLHNEGRGHTYEKESTLDSLYDRRHSLYGKSRELKAEISAVQDKYKPLAKAAITQQEWDDVYARFKEEIGKKQDELSETENEIKAITTRLDNSFPDAPFRTTYHEYVLKRLLRMAAEEGYDSIGWTPSWIQSDRWSDEFAEAYRIEYDQDIPKFLRKYGKKWGATVGKTAIDKDAVKGKERILKETELENVKRDIESAKRELARKYDGYERAILQRSIESMEKTVATLEQELSASLSVWSMDITDSMKESVLYEGQTLYQDRNPDSYSNRSLLAGALEGVAQNDIERDKLQQYKEKIDLLNAEEQKLLELRAKIKELSFAKGTRDTEAIKKLQLEATKAANRVNIYDKQLLNLESTKALKGVLEREKALARKKAMQRGKETLQRYRERAAQTQRELMDRYQESRKRGVESRNKTAMRHKIKDVVNDLNNYLLKGTKDKHVPIELQKAVAEALDAVNMDTVGAEERIAKKRAEMMSAKTPEAVERLAKEIEHIQEMGGNMAAKISRLKTAYDSIINSEDTIVAGSHDEVISSTIEKVMEFVGDTPLRDMSLPQLEAVYDMYRMVLHSIRAANKAFTAQKSVEISVIANRVMEEIKKQGKQKKLRSKADEALSAFDWNNQKPVYAFERIGSDTFTEVFGNVRSGEDTWAVDMTEAKAFLEAQKRQHRYNAWNLDKTYSFTSSSGMKFKLNLPQIMSLYAYSKRGDQAKEHLKYGGFVFDGLTEVKTKTAIGTTKTYQLKDATSYNISEETLADIISKLTPEQKAFADAMQEYLSTTMGEKGNEVSLELYGVKLFKEKNYFPLKSAPQYLERAREQAQGDVKIKNKGFTKETTPKAKNPIVLTSFMDVWAGHVNEMSMYHSFTLPLEDFYRVFNYKIASQEENLPTEGVIPFLENAHGGAAVSYVDQLLKDLNGGARSDPRENVAKSLMTNFKKASVIASASVVVQQPSAIIRAQALVDAKYFVGISGKKHSDTWTEIKKYAPVAIIKEMGYFDVGMGQSSVEWLKGEKTLKDKMDDALSKAPALADEYTWGAIWNAVKRETARKNPKLKTSSEEFLKLCGERFTEVIVKTQVYDSTLARSANMRSKSAFMNMLTAFMAEPTTSINMLADAFKKGNKKQIARTMGAVYGSVILNSALVSLVYAMRDDDEDETFLEKYLSRLTTEVIDGINPLTYLPFVKDIWSAAQGFDVERADMTLITKTLDSLQQLIKVAGRDRSDMSAEELREHNKAINEAILSITDNLASLTGLPVKNIRRDINAVINGFKTIKADMEGRETTAGSLADNILEDVKDSLPVVGWLPGDSKGDKLYRAIVSGDKAYAERLKSGYSSDSAYNSAIRKALRENDPRIKEAAEARYNGDIAEYMRIAKSIIAEGHFKQDDVVAAINSEINAMKPDDGGTTSSDKAVSLYKIEDYYAALDESSFAADTVKEDMIAVEVVNGKDRDEAETSFYSKFVSHIRDMYDKGEINDYKAKDMLVRYGDKTDAEAASKVQYWSFKKEYPDYDLSESAVSKYYSDVKPSGISIDVYYDYSKQRSKAEGVDLNGDGKTDSGSVKREVLQIINSLPISRYQKNVLYYLNGWSQSTMSEAPWY